jgi:hypothetical protein
MWSRWLFLLIIDCQTTILFDVNLDDDDDQRSPKMLSSLSSHIEICIITEEPGHLTRT